MVTGIMGPLPRSGVPSYMGASTRAGDGDRALPSSTGVGDGALFSSSATPLGGGVPAVSSPLLGYLLRPYLGSGPHRPSLSQGQQRAVPWAVLWQFALRRSDRQPLARLSSSPKHCRINIRGSTTKKIQSKITTPKSNSTKKETFLDKLTDWNFRAPQ